MKNIKNKFFILIFTLLGALNSFAGPSNPPVPGAKKPPPPPGLPIDGDIFILLIMGIFLGLYIVYKFQLKTKAPI